MLCAGNSFVVTVSFHLGRAIEGTELLRNVEHDAEHLEHRALTMPSWLLRVLSDLSLRGGT